MIAAGIATVCGVGYLRPAPGTWGSVAALPLFWAAYVAGGPWACAALLAPIVAAGWWATARMTAGAHEHDPGHIVIDEVAGQWLALMPLALGASRSGADILALWPGWIAAFALFRLLDIWKPGPVGWADRKRGPAGVMLDDLIAGMLAGLGVLLLAALAHGVMRL